jgi:hypothetical protein
LLYYNNLCSVNNLNPTWSLWRIPTTNLAALIKAMIFQLLLTLNITFYFTAS